MYVTVLWYKGEGKVACLPEVIHKGDRWGYMLGVFYHRDNKQQSGL